MFPMIFKYIALLSPIFVSLFWSLIFFIQFGKKDKTKLYLGVFMTIAFLFFFSQAILFGKQFQLYPYIDVIYISSMLSLCPLFYSYLLRVALKKIIRSRNFYRLMPAIVLGLLAFMSVLFLNYEERTSYLEDILVSRNIKNWASNSKIGIKGIIFIVSWFLFIFQAIFFGIKGVQLLRNYKMKIMEYYSSSKGKTINWGTLIGIIVLFAAVASFTLALIFGSYLLENVISLIIPSIICCVVFFVLGLIGNQGSRQDLGNSIPEFDFDIEGEGIGKQAELKEQLLSLFEIQKVYTKTDLRITTIADELKTNRTYISNLINEDFRMSFSDFVNMYRIKEAKELMKGSNRKTLTLEEIAEKSGFGSIHSFTRVFKAVDGIPPGRFRSNLNRAKQL